MEKIFSFDDYDDGYVINMFFGKPHDLHKKNKIFQVFLLHLPFKAQEFMSTTFSIFIIAPRHIAKCLWIEIELYKGSKRHEICDLFITLDIITFIHEKCYLPGIGTFKNLMDYILMRRKGDLFLIIFWGYWVI